MLCSDKDKPPTHFLDFDQIKGQRLLKESRKEVDITELFAAALKEKLHQLNHGSWEVAEQEELLVPVDYEITITEDAIRTLCEAVPYDESYRHRIKWSEEKIAQWEAEGKPRLWLPEDCILDNHSNREHGIQQGWVAREAKPHCVNPLTGQKFETDAEGHPLHPHWRWLLKHGIPAGHGFYFYEGNVGAIENDVAAQDPFIFRAGLDKTGRPILQVLVGVRTDDSQNSYAFLGGMRDKLDTDKKGLSENALRIFSSLTSVREAREEGVDLTTAPFLPIINAPVLDKRTTLNAFVTTGVTAFFIEGDLEITPNPEEMQIVEWETITNDLLKPGVMFASHGQLLQMALKVIHEKTGIGVNKSGRVVTTKKAV